MWVERPEGQEPHKFLRRIGRSDVDVEGRGSWDSGGVGKVRRQWAIGGRKLALPRLGCSKGCNWAPHRDKTMIERDSGRKHDKRQKLVGYLKRFLRKPWFMRLVIGVVWKLLDRFF